MYDKSQLMRGTLEGSILKILLDETTYGYEIVTRLQKYGFEDIKEELFILSWYDWKRKNIISSEFRPSPLGPSRKYYSLTEEGQAYFEEFKTYWMQVSASVNKLLSLEGRS